MSIQGVSLRINMKIYMCVYVCVCVSMYTYNFTGVNKIQSILIIPSSFVQ